MIGLSRSRVEWRMLGRAVTIMSIAVVVTRTTPFSVCRRITLRLARVRDVWSVPPEAPRLLVRAVDTASRVVPGGGNCLVRAITGRALMARYGLESEVVIGVAKNPAGVFESHAWLRHNGETIIGGTGLGRFAPIARIGEHF